LSQDRRPRKDGEPFYREDPDALGRIFVGPYLAFEPELSFILEDEQGICGYALGAFDSGAFYARYEKEWRPNLCARFPEPKGDRSTWTRVQHVHSWYHRSDYFCPEPYEKFPSHLTSICWSAPAVAVLAGACWKK
jgi:hypothetical protein